ncbi:MAG TPA: MFS transporter [Phenylobacterium sp.]|jgi:ACS family tartrate transporter-like MFS transporter|nr:MFS transporter [Phenylobacterium sp.]
MVASIEVSAIRKVGVRLIPFLAVLYFAAFIDRVNISFAAAGMNHDLGFSPYVYGLGAGIFFAGYVLLEAPSNLILHRVGARRWIARIMVTWALVAGAMAFVKNANSFYLVRFLLGVAEAGFFPGVIYYLTQWVPAARRAQLIGLFMTAIPISTALGGPISSAVLQLNGLFGLAGWQWLFLTETVPSLILGIAVLVYLPDRPADAKWLSADEKAWLARALDAEAADRRARYGSGVAKMLTDPRVLMLCLAYFGVEIGLYGVIFWLPQILKSTGAAEWAVGYLVAIPYGFAALAMVWWCRHSDRAKERVWHIAAASLVGSFGLAGSAFLAHSSGNLAPVLSVAAITFSAVGTLAILPIFWTLPAATLNGAAAAGGIAVINAVGNIGGFIGPFAIGWIKDATGDFTYGLLALAGGVLLTGIVTLAIGHDCAAERAGADAPGVAA